MIKQGMLQCVADRRLILSVALHCLRILVQLLQDRFSITIKHMIVQTKLN